MGNQVTLTAIDCSNCSTSNPQSYSVSTPSTVWNVAGAMFNDGDAISNISVSFPKPVSCAINLWDRNNATGSLFNIYQSDKVGIGTLSPSERLDVNGGLRVRTLALDNSLTSLVVADNNGVLKYKTDPWTRDAGNGFLFATNTADKLGIGTNSPTEKLDVNGTLRVRSIANNNALTKFMVVDNNGVVNYKDNLTSFGGWYKSGTTTTPTSINDNIYNSGLVGIGTSIPAKILDIFAYEPELRIKDNSPIGNPKSVSITLGNAVGFWSLSGPRSYDVKNNFSIWWNAGSWKRYFTATDDGRFLMGNNTSPSVIGNYRLYVDGDAYTTGSMWYTSDKRLKNTIQQIETPLEKISRLNGYTYYFNQMPDSVMSLSKEKQYGLIAQELLEVMPEAVRLNESGYYAVNYDMVIPVLVEATKEQQKTITEQDAKIEKLEKDMEEIKTLLKQQGTLPKTSESSVLNYINIRPNPTYGKTSVDYTITENYTTAKLIVYNELGQKVGEYKVTQKGMGSVDVDATSFSGGIYFCNLVVDGNIKEVKKFIVSK